MACSRVDLPAPLAPNSPRMRPSSTVKSTPSSATVLPKDLRNERSEEHTSELQSQSNLVCRLLLEKKKRKPHRPAGPPNPRPYPAPQRQDPPPIPRPYFQVFDKERAIAVRIR